MTSGEIHAEQVQRNRARFGTDTFPGGYGEWPDFPDMIAYPLPPAPTFDDPVVIPADELAAMTPTYDDPPIDDYPLWEG